MQTWENGKNSNFGSNFGLPTFFSWVLPLVRHCSKLSTYTAYLLIPIETNEPDLRKWRKT